jgi:cysteine dioxygenase
MNVIRCLPLFLNEKTNPTITQMEKLIRCIPYTTYEQIVPFITSPKPPLNYGRNVIYSTERFEVIVLHLPAHTETPIHDHGESFCCVKIIKGTLHNRIFDLSPHLTLRKEDTYTADDYFTVTTDQIHSMYNPSKEALISFHIYTPPIRDNHIYPVENYHR